MNIPAVGHDSDGVPLAPRPRHVLGRGVEVVARPGQLPHAARQR
ncbi:MAG: hypothetical protein ABIK89_19995 [Planctomycetota bacterium]